MDKITSFKEFVKKNPSLLNHVKTGSMNWQKFYEMYDLYGDENSVWDDYLRPEKKEQVVNDVAVGTTFSDVLAWLKGINLDKMQEGINSVQRVLGVLEDFSSKEDTNVKAEYQPRPLYKHFED